MSGARVRSGSVAPERLRRFGGGGVALFGEMLVTGLVTAACSVALVTAVPALAAAVQHLDRHLDDRSDAVSDLLSLTWRALRTGWLVGVAATAAIAMLAWNIALGLQGLVPGGIGFAVISGALALGVAVVACRMAVLWSPDTGWRALPRRAWAEVVADPVGDAYIVIGLGVSIVMVWMLAPLVVITPGVVALALVAVRRRRR